MRSEYTCPQCNRTMMVVRRRCYYCTVPRGPRGRICPIEERFWGKIERSGGDDACWTWVAGVVGDGRGRLYLGEPGHRWIYAHRFSWELTNGPIPDGMLVCHNCPDGDNPRCVNPRHLFLGTQLDNVRDMWRKGRGRSGWSVESLAEARKLLPRGEAHHMARLTADQVREIRSRHAAGEMGYARLAKEYNVAMATVRNIAKRRIWSHID